jgi:hypothetical protein
MSFHRPSIVFPKPTTRRGTFHDQLRAAEEARARHTTPSISSIEMPPPAYQPARDPNLTVAEFYTLLERAERQSRSQACAPRAPVPRAPVQRAPAPRLPVRLRRRCFTFDSQGRKSKFLVPVHVWWFVVCGDVERVLIDCVLGNLVCWLIAVFCIAFLILTTVSYSSHYDGREAQAGAVPVVVSAPVVGH